MKQAMTCQDWMKAVNERIKALCGVSADDLPDVCYGDWYAEGMTTSRAAVLAVRNAKEN